MIEPTLLVQADEAVIEVGNLYDQDMSTLKPGRLVDRFTRRPESGGKQQTGLGLGLSTVQSIMRVHGDWAIARLTDGRFIVQLWWPLSR